ncbi:MAG: hypothetical protein PF588_06365 [Candidatus Kapabacteria bacterium]|jgi:hypothetical protein|nr:hypothetical protein [Candidatus Kapabacteria bacterium]
MKNKIKLLFAVLSLILFARANEECFSKCVGYGKISVYDYINTDLIFQGQILEIESGTLQLFTMKVTKAIKNCSVGDTLEICAHRFLNPAYFQGLKGEEWLMYCTYVSPEQTDWYYGRPPFSGGYVTDYCQRNSIVGTDQYNEGSNIVIKPGDLI